MKRSTRIATVAVAVLAAAGLSTAPAVAAPPPPDENGYTHAIPSFDISCFGLNPNLVVLPVQAGFAIFDTGGGAIDAMLTLPEPLVGQYYSHIDFKWENLTTGRSGTEHRESVRRFTYGPENFKPTTGFGRIKVSANISNSSTPDSVGIPMTPCSSYFTIS